MQFARLETSLAYDLRRHLESHIGKMPEAGERRLSASIYGSMRFSASRDLVKRIATEEGYEPARLKFITDLFVHVGHIADLRDRIAHHHLRTKHGSEREFLLTDIFATKRIVEAKTYEFHLNALFCAGVDLIQAWNRIHQGLLKRKGEPDALDLTPLAWQYKPSMLKLLRRKSATSRAGLPHLPPPSND